MCQFANDKVYAPSWTVWEGATEAVHVASLRLNLSSAAVEQMGIKTWSIGGENTVFSYLTAQEEQ